MTNNKNHGGGGVTKILHNLWGYTFVQVVAQEVEIN